MPNVHFLTYYELHDIPWRLTENVRLKDSETSLQVEIGRGPYIVPRMASPIEKTMAGGATMSTVNENYTLEGHTYVGVDLPLEAGVSLGLFDPLWNELRGQADDIAATVSLCLGQRFSPKQVAQYTIELREDGSVGPMQFLGLMFPGAKASVSRRSIGSIRRAIDRLISGVSPQTLVALRWHGQSKSVTIGADRLVALWIALEALMSPVSSHVELVNKTADALSLKKFGLGLSSRQVIDALGLNHIRRIRNEIIHHGKREVPWPVGDDPTLRDWPQILNDIVEEVLRQRMRATPTKVLKAHVADGLKLTSAN